MTVSSCSLKSEEPQQLFRMAGSSSSEVLCMVSAGEAAWISLRKGGEPGGVLQLTSPDGDILFQSHTDRCITAFKVRNDKMFGTSCTAWIDIFELNTGDCLASFSYERTVTAVHPSAFSPGVIAALETGRLLLWSSDDALSAENSIEINVEDVWSRELLATDRTESAASAGPVRCLTDTEQGSLVVPIPCARDVSTQVLVLLEPVHVPEGVRVDVCSVRLPMNSNSNSRPFIAGRQKSLNSNL